MYELKDYTKFPSPKLGLSLKSDFAKRYFDYDAFFSVP